MSPQLFSENIYVLEANGHFCVQTMFGFIWTRARLGAGLSNSLNPDRLLGIMAALLLVAWAPPCLSLLRSVLHENRGSQFGRSQFQEVG